MPPSTNGPDLAAVISYFKQLQDNICGSLEELEPAAGFTRDAWSHEQGGGGITQVIEQGDVFEKGGVNFSHVKGANLPPAATANRVHIAGKPFEATGVSLVMHPRNPYVPCCHMNVRFFLADADGADPVWWFGGGYDLTPCYGFDQDCRHWHRTAKQACERFNHEYYPRFKDWCDRYFYLKHRDESRGIGGVFFDDFKAGGFSHAFEFIQGIGNSFIQAYRPIVQRCCDMSYGERQRAFQCYRRGRYVEFNLVYDRGTLFGLQSGGRTESILMSMPPVVHWTYDWQPEAGSDEQKLVEYYLKPKDWLAGE